MVRQPNISTNKLVYYRLISLWVLSEAMLGGIIHGLKIPVSGLIVGSCAVLCISLIAWYNPTKGAILKATLIVAIFKMILSPQAPLPAYFAVLFQGLLGESLFWKRKFFGVACLSFAVIALLESALQRIAVLTIIYGNGLWKAANDFLNGLTGQRQVTNYSLLLAGFYVALHLLMGLVVGWVAGRLPGNLGKWDRLIMSVPSIYTRPTEGIEPRRKKTLRIRRGLAVTWAALFILFIQSYFRIGRPLLSSHVVVQILFRSALIVLTWVIIVSPLLKRALQYWLRQKRTLLHRDVQNVIELLPSSEQIVRQAWSQSSSARGWRRLSMATKMILATALNEGTVQRKIFILSAPISSGKTTSIRAWAKERNEVFGILTPVINGDRMFLDVSTGECFPMESSSGDEETISVGRFRFSRHAFERACTVIRQAIPRAGWLIIDEIGPLELRGEGFAEVLKEVLRSKTIAQNILIVVREGMVDTVCSHFDIKNFREINSIATMLVPLSR